MRFKAVLEREQFAVLFSQLKLLQEQGKSAILSLSTDVVRTIVTQDDEALQLFATLSTGAVFNEFKIESRTGNVICLEVLLGNLVHALRSGLGAHATTLKLAKRGGAPFLSISTQIVEGGVEVVQDVPVRVLGAAEMERYKEPELGPVTARLTFPSPKPVAAVVDRMRTLLAGGGSGSGGAGGGGGGGSGSASGSGGHLRIETDPGARQVTLSVRTETVAARTYFRDLIRDAEALGEGGAGDAAAAGAGDGSREQASVIHVNIRHMHKALRAVASIGSSLLMCLVPRRVLILHGENADRTSSVTFLLALVDAGASAY